MNNSQILAGLKLLGIALFGALIYEKKNVLFPNVTAPVQPSIFGQNQLVIKDEASGEVAYVPLYRGVPANKPSYDIYRFEAVRDAKGKTKDGREWAVQKGKVVAYAM